MFISWSGRGLVVIPIVIVVGFLCISLLPAEYSFLWLICTFIFAGIIIYLLGNHWNTYKQPLPQEGSLVEEAIQYKKIIHNNHKLYWIPMQYFGVVLIVLGLTLAILSIIK